MATPLEILFARSRKSNALVAMALGGPPMALTAYAFAVLMPGLVRGGPNGLLLLGLILFAQSAYFARGALRYFSAGAPPLAPISVAAHRASLLCSLATVGIGLYFASAEVFFVFFLSNPADPTAFSPESIVTFVLLGTVGLSVPVLAASYFFAEFRHGRRGRPDVSHDEDLNILVLLINCFFAAFILLILFIPPS